MGVQVTKQNWVAVKELKLSCQNPQTLLFHTFPCYGNLFQVPEQQPSKRVWYEPRGWLQDSPQRDPKVLQAM